MTPKQIFDTVWSRCTLLTALHAYIANNAAAILQPDELLRAEWVARVSALDLYIHELVAQGMSEIFAGNRGRTRAFEAFSITNETVDRIRHSLGQFDEAAAFDLEVRRKLSFISYQDPDKIADGVRLISAIELWNSVAVYQGATEANKKKTVQSIKGTLSAIVERRNKIAHEGDLQPGLPRVPWPVTQPDVNAVSDFIERLVVAIDAVVK